MSDKAEMILRHAADHAAAAGGCYPATQKMLSDGIFKDLKAALDAATASQRERLEAFANFVCRHVERVSFNAEGEKTAKEIVAAFEEQEKANG